MPPSCVLLLGVLLTLACSCGSHGSREVEERLIGWKGDTYKPMQSEAKPQWISTISWKPRASVFHNFISDAEAQHIADLAAITMRRSTVVADNGSSVEDDYRTSYGTFLTRYQTEVVQAIEERLALWSRVPAVHQEDMQVLRYGVGQYYHAHMDSLDNDSPRMATVLIYLADPEEGGETAFPGDSVWAHPDMGRLYGPFSDCVKKNVAFKPRRGDALMFWSIKPDGTTEDPFSEHEGCPVVKGVKWTATKWVHSQPFRPEEWNDTAGRFNRVAETDDPGVCMDYNERCGLWAAKGECTKNAEFMLGVGGCRKSCKSCIDCPNGDKECVDRNRKQLGYLVYDPAEIQVRNTKDQFAQQQDKPQ